MGSSRPVWVRFCSVSLIGIKNDTRTRRLSEREEGLSMREEALLLREEAAKRATEEAQSVKNEIEKWAVLNDAIRMLILVAGIPVW